MPVVTGTPSGDAPRSTLRTLTQYIKKIGQKAWDALTSAEKKIQKAKHMKPTLSKTGLLRAERKRVKKRQEYEKELGYK